MGFQTPLRLTFSHWMIATAAMLKPRPQIARTAMTRPQMSQWTRLTMRTMWIPPPRDHHPPDWMLRWQC